MKTLNLYAGERHILSDGEKFLRVVSGTAEVYAVTKDRDKFHRALMTERGAGEAIFPAYDEFQQLDIVVYAATEVRLEEQAYAETAPALLQELMTDWLRRLATLPWVQTIADRGDEELQKWQSGLVFAAGDTSLESLAAVFRRQAALFAMLQGMRFQAEDKQAEKRIGLRERQRERLRREAVGALLGENVILYEEDEVAQVSSLAGEVNFIVRAALKALGLPHRGLSVSADAVKKSSAADLLRRLAQKGNMGLRPVTLDKDWYVRDTGVFIGYFTADNGKKIMAAIVPDTSQSYRLLTKDNPDGIPLTADLAKQVKKKAFQCYAGLPEHKLTASELWRFMLSRVRSEDYRVIFLTSVLAGIIPLLTPIVTETMFRDILPIADYRGLVIVTQVIFVAVFTLTTLSVIRSALLLQTAMRINMDTEAAFILRLLSLPEKFFRRFDAGELANRVYSVEKIKNVIGDNFATVVFNLLFSFWSIALMCWYSPPLTLAAVTVWLFWAAATAFFYRRMAHFRQQYIAAQNKQGGMVRQIFNGLVKFRFHGADEQAYYIWSRYFGESMRHKFALLRHKNYSNIIGAVQPFAMTVIIYYIAFYLTQIPGGANAPAVVAPTQQASFGYAEFLAFTAAYTAFNATLGAALPALGRLFSLKQHIENLRPLLEEVPEQRSDKIEAEPLSGAIEVSHLTFSYGDGQPDILQDLSFRVAARENLAIVGKSGCGKSTLVRLLLGFEQPQTGAIYYDGQSLVEVSLPSVRSQMGVVLQNGQLMTGDIFSNIAGQMPLTEADAWAAAEAAGIADDIRAMPMGMHTIINEGSNNISGGQRQRLMIARALALKPAIIIFDEATGALDNKSQAVVTASLDKLNITRIIIAHRLSTVKNCDRILVLDKGRIAESGTFAELQKKGGIFADLVKRQLA